MNSFKYQCSECGKTFDITPQIMLCDKCSKAQEQNEPLRGILEVTPPKKASLEDIFSFLPLEKKNFPNLPVGNSPIWTADLLGRETGFDNLYIKNDGTNPTASFKDRASWPVAAFAKTWGINEIVLASTGNAASSMAGIGACAGLKVTIFLPENVPMGKLVQSLQYGARVILVDGNYDAAYELSMQYSKEKGGLNRNTAYNPITIEGKKTVSIEIVRDLKKAPDHVFVPVGDGVILSGVYKGFRDLLSLGLIDKVPTIHAIQSSTSDAIHRAWNNGGKFDFKHSSTIADSICVDVPRCGHLAVKNLYSHNGKCITVSDDEILVAQKTLSEKAGLFTEPAGAASYAGFLKAKDQIEKDSTIVILATGMGLKDLSAAQNKIKIPTKTVKDITEID